RCVCPALTEGERCERCKQGTWNYHPNKGCTRCKCHQEGSVYGQCDQITGKCRCLEGFEGDNCDRCAAGFYRFPNCRACNCIVPGTDPEVCSSGVCQCDESGVCPCKSTVVGKKCASCAPGFFGLSALNPEGCTQCFCFGRSSQCTQAQYSWTQLVMPRRRHLRISRGESDLDVEDGLLVVPGDDKDVVVGVNHLFKVPLYW
ncbi:laminin subunit alpha-1, partial [Eurytemora carolleeae]|uniref:laminin subunit alpha-1 n=1 Tax=Eurytemora carolleeae TaxID=1294199 RepID=UPI000C78174F